MAVSGITETKQYLAYNLGEEIFAVDVLKVREVLESQEITKVPRAPDFMKGIINVRGVVVPVIDMHVKFGMEETEKTVNTCVILLEVEFDGETTVLGAQADAVREVIDLEPDQIEQAPKIGSKWKTEFIKGIGKRNDEFIILLDIDRIFSADEIALVQGEAIAEKADSPNDGVELSI
ncbi:MAG: chemotaxis protein CheW [Deltaproteobacteria bacterium]|nr:chemotaxis protein CheW [Deltaproteobacteria bacterium]